MSGAENRAPKGVWIFGKSIFTVNSDFEAEKITLGRLELVGVVGQAWKRAQGPGNFFGENKKPVVLRRTGCFGRISFWGGSQFGR
jgi:hypothetical protein